MGIWISAGPSPLAGTVIPLVGEKVIPEAAGSDLFPKEGEA